MSPKEGVNAREFADAPLDSRCPISAEEVLFPGMFGDVAMLRNPSEEKYHIKTRYVYLGSTHTGESEVPDF